MTNCNELGIKNAPHGDRAAEYYCHAFQRLSEGAPNGVLELEYILLLLYGERYIHRLPSHLQQRMQSVMKVNWNDLSPPPHLVHFFAFLSYLFGSGTFTEEELQVGWRMKQLTTLS